MMAIRTDRDANGRSLLTELERGLRDARPSAPEAPEHKSAREGVNLRRWVP